MKRNKFEKTRKDTRWKRGETVVVERVIKQIVRVKMEKPESQERFEFFKFGKHSRGKGRQLVVIEKKKRKKKRKKEKE